MDKITETKQWEVLQSKLKQLEEEAVLKEQEEKGIKTFSEPFEYHELDNDADYGYKRVSKAEYARLIRQLNEWHVLYAGKIIKEEGPGFVKRAVELTLACMDKVKKPGAYFRGVLKNLK